MPQDFKDGWREDWLSSIAELSDVEEQKRLWLDPNQDNPHYSCSEYINSYFDLFGGGERSYTDYIEDGFISNLEVSCIIGLHSLLVSYVPPNNNYWDLIAILDDPGWLEIANEAKAATSCLREILTDDEVTILEGRVR